ncbi:hypothetical protein [Eikenella corrodens]|nr:hypothetical protein [Eikenella corrodens]
MPRRHYFQVASTGIADEDKLSCHSVSGSLCYHEDKTHLLTQHS